MAYQSVYRNGVWQIEDDENPGVGVTDVSGAGGDHVLEALKTAQVRTPFGFDVSEFFLLSRRSVFINASDGAYGSTGDPASNVEAYKEAVWNSFVQNSYRSARVSISGQLRVNTCLKNTTFGDGGTEQRVDLVLESPSEGRSSGFIDRIDYDVVLTGTAQAGGSATTIVLDSSATGTYDNEYSGRIIVLNGGSFSNERHLIIDYVASTKTATLAREVSTGADPAGATYAIWDATAFRSINRNTLEGGGFYTWPDIESPWLTIGTSAIGNCELINMAFRSELGPALHVSSGNRAIKTRAVNVRARVNAQHGYAQAGSTSNTIKLHAGASTIDGAYNGCTVFITNGTGSGNAVRTITDYDGTTKVATISGTWSVETPSTDSRYTIRADYAAAFLVTTCFGGEFDCEITDTSSIGLYTYNAQSPTFHANIFNAGTSAVDRPAACIYSSGSDFDLHIEGCPGYGLQLRGARNRIKLWIEQCQEDNFDSFKAPFITVSGYRNTITKQNSQDEGSTYRPHNIRFEDARAVLTNRFIDVSNDSHTWIADLHRMACSDANTPDGKAYWSLNDLGRWNTPYAYAYDDEYGSGQNNILVRNRQLVITNGSYDVGGYVSPFFRVPSHYNYRVETGDIIAAQIRFSVDDPSFFDDEKFTNNWWTLQLTWGSGVDWFRRYGVAECDGVHTLFAWGEYPGGGEALAGNFRLYSIDTRTGSAVITVHDLEFAVVSYKPVLT